VPAPPVQHTRFRRRALVTRPARTTQLQYMGFPGSLGANYVPFLVTDRVVSPPEYAGVYSVTPGPD